MKIIKISAIKSLVLWAIIFLLSQSSTRGPLFAEETYSGLKSAHRLFQNAEKLFMKKKYGRAVKQLNKCLKKFPLHSRSEYYLSQIAYIKGNYQTALTHVNAAKKKFGNYFRAQRSVFATRRKELKDKRQNIRLAIAEYNHTLNTTEANCQTKRVMANLRQSQGSLAETNWHLDKTFPDDAVIPSGYYFLHGNIFFKLKSYDKASYQYKMAIRIDPKNSDAYNNLANVAFTTRNYRVAQFYLSEAEEKGANINPQFKDHLNDLVTRVEIREQNTIFPRGIKRFVCRAGDIFNPIFENSYVVFDPITKDAVLIDPGSSHANIERFILSNSLKIHLVLNTHGHYDHVAANNHYAEKYKADVCGHEADLPLYGGKMSVNQPNRFFKPMEIVQAGTLTLQVLHTPGHTAGSVCFLVRDSIITGDTLFKRQIGATGGKTSREQIVRLNQLIEQIREKLLTLDPTYNVLSGHGLPSSIGEERQFNPFLNKKRSIDLLKESFKDNNSIKLISLAKTAKNYDAKIIFYTIENLNSFKLQYGEKIVGLNLLLTTDNK